MTRQTSLAVFKEIQDNGLLSQKRQQVYKVLLDLGPSTGAEVAQEYKRRHPASEHSESIRNRLTELRDLGCIEEQGTTICSITERKVLRWAINGKLPITRKRSQIEHLKKKIAYHQLKAHEYQRRLKIERSKIDSKFEHDQPSLFQDLI